MCVGDLSLPGGRTALIKLGWRDGGSEGAIKRVECTSLRRKKRDIHAVR